MNVRRNNYIQLLLLCTWICLPNFVEAQDITISGTIKDASNQEALIGATIVVPEDKIGTNSDANGNYSLKITPKGRAFIQLQISYTGFSKQVVDIPLDQGNISRDIILESEAFTTDDVVITASKGFEQKQSDLTVSIEVVKQDAIDKQATTNMDRILTQIPGIDVLDGQVSIRGSSGFAYGVGSRVMVMMNGLPLLSGDAGSIDFRLIPVDNIGRIEVVKGASSMLYGSSALGGVINIITDDPGDEPLTSVRLRAGFYDQPKFKALDWDGDASPWQASAHLFHTRKVNEVMDLTLQTDFIKETGYRQGTDREEFRGMLMTKFRPKNIPGLTFGVNLGTRVDSSGAMLYWRGYYPDTINNEVSGGALTPPLPSATDSTSSRKQLGVRITADPFVKYLTKGGDIFWYRGRYLRNQNNNNTGQSANTYVMYNDFLYQTTLGKNINWVSGLTYTYSFVNGADLYGTDSLTAGGETIRVGGRFSGNSLGVYTQFDAKFGRLNTSMGLRMESVQIAELDRETVPLFRAGVNYEIARGTNVRASAGQAFRAPSVAERYTSTTGGGVIVEPNPLIKSEKGFSAEIGFRQGFKFGGGGARGRGYIDISAFRMQYDDMVEFGLQEIKIDFNPTTGGVETSGVFSTINVSDARITGAELTALAEMDFGKWYFNITGGVTYIDPINQNSVSEANQLDLSSWPNDILIRLQDIANPEIVDQPSILKYRTRWTTRASATLGVQKISLTSNFRARSFMESIDQFMYLIVNDLGDFRQRHPDGSKVFDFIATYEINDKSRIAINVNNAFNEEYMVIPGFLAEQRNFSLQYQIKF